MVALRVLREKQGLNQMGLAKKSGVPQPTIWLIEQGLTQRPRLSTMTRLAEALGCEPGDLLEPVEAK